MKLALNNSLAAQRLLRRRAAAADPRPDQRRAIANGTCIYYWPFDEQDMTVTNAIRVVTANARGAVGTDFSAPLSVLGGTITPSWSDYAMRLNDGYFEWNPPPAGVPAQLAGDMARRLVAGRQASAALTLVLNDEASELFDYYPIDPRTYAYLFVMQYVKETGVNTRFLWDYANDWGWGSSVDDHLDAAMFQYPSGIASGNNITLPTAAAAANGEVRTVGWYYNGTANLLYGFRGAGAGDTVTWGTGATFNVVGSSPAQETSGIGGPVGKIQGVYAIEFTTPPSLGTVQTAVDQTRANWKAGNKVLPPALYA